MGGLLSDHASWRIAFGAQVPLCLLAVGISFTCMQMHQHEQRRSPDIADRALAVDISGAFLLSFTVLAILISTYLLPLVIRDQRLWLLWSLTLLTAVSSAFLLFRVETQTRNPIINLSMLKTHETLSLCVLNFAASFTYHALLYSVPFYVVVVDGDTSTEAGLRLLPMAAAASVGSLLVGWLLATYRRYRHILIVASIMVVTGPALCSVTAFSTLSSTLYKVLQALSIFAPTLGFQVISSVSLVALLAQQGEKSLAACTSLATREYHILLNDKYIVLTLTVSSIEIDRQCFWISCGGIPRPILSLCVVRNLSFRKQPSGVWSIFDPLD